MNQDKKMYCCDCNAEFMYTAGMQDFMEGLKRDGKLDRKNESTGEWIEGQIVQPKRCNDCRDMKKSRYPQQPHTRR